ncbi:MAG TPA: ATP-binding protein [Candidatus Acidoferrales bacterium]|nr:ATP-binding protein [Candidatus Acidoferrales bacterium]
MNSRSIKFRLVAWYAGLLACIFLVLCAALYLDLRNFLERGLCESQTRRIHQLSSAFLAHVQQTGEPAVIRQIQDWYAPESNDRFIRITRADGSLAYVSEAPKDGSFEPGDVPPSPPLPGTESIRKQKLPHGHTLLIASLRYKSTGNPDYLVEFGALLDPVENMLNHLFLQLALGLPLAVVISAAGGYWLVHRALRPVALITVAAEQITQLNLSERLPVANSGDELERLTVSLNRMIARLDDALQNSRRFAADASHDLRTPLTILRGELESLVEDPKLDEELCGRLAGLLEEAIHLSKIVEQLFTLTQLDSGNSCTERKRFDLSELALTTADQMGLLAEDKNISLSCEACQPTFIVGDRSRIKQVIVNLLDNAIKYTPANGKVLVRVEAVDGHVVLEVEDSGIGIPAEALPHVFERFYRVDKTRSAEAESAGLGLSIVKSICTAHGAVVQAASVPNLGSRFTITLPAARNSPPAAKN